MHAAKVSATTWIPGPAFLILGSCTIDACTWWASLLGWLPSTSSLVYWQRKSCLVVSPSPPHLLFPLSSDSGPSPPFSAATALVQTPVISGQDYDSRLLSDLPAPVLSPVIHLLYCHQGDSSKCKFDQPLLPTYKTLLWFMAYNAGHYLSPACLMSSFATTSTHHAWRKNSGCRLLGCESWLHF